MPVENSYGFRIAVSSDKSGVARNVPFFRTREHPVPDALLKPAMSRIQHTTEKLQTITTGKDHIVVAVQAEAKLIVHKCFHTFTILHSFIATVCENDKVVTVPKIVLDAESVFHVPVEFV